MHKWVIGGAATMALITIVLMVVIAKKPDPDTPTVSIDAIQGTWTIGPDSYAGYHVHAVNGDIIFKDGRQNVTATGRTDRVTGSATVTNNELTAATVEVDLAGITSDSEQRDKYFRTKIIDVAACPTATFTIAQPVKMADPSKIAVPGDFTINNVTLPVVADMNITGTETNPVVTGSVQVTWQDFDIDPPKLGFVTVADAGVIEFLLKLSK